MPIFALLSLTMETIFCKVTCFIYIYIKAEGFSWATFSSYAVQHFCPIKATNLVMAYNQGFKIHLPVIRNVKWPWIEMLRMGARHTACYVAPMLTLLRATWLVGCTNWHKTEGSTLAIIWSIDTGYSKWSNFLSPWVVCTCARLDLFTSSGALAETQTILFSYKKWEEANTGSASVPGLPWPMHGPTWLMGHGNLVRHAV